MAIANIIPHLLDTGPLPFILICLLSWFHVSVGKLVTVCCEFQSESGCYTKDSLELMTNFRAARPLSKVGEDKITLK